MINKKMAIAMLLLVSLSFFAGCTGDSSTQTSIKSQEEAAEVVGDVSVDIEGVAEALQDIDDTLG